MDRIINMFADLVRNHKEPAPKNDFEKGVLDGIVTARYKARILIQTIQREENSRIIECSKCGEKTSLIELTNFKLVEDGVWLCPDCSKDHYEAEGC